MLNLILSGSQYIYQNLIKNIWFPAVTWKAHILHGAHQNSRHSDSCPDSAGRAAAGPAPSAGLRPSRARSAGPEQSAPRRDPRLLILPKTEPPGFAYLEIKHAGVSEAPKLGPSSRNRSQSSPTAANMSSCNIFGFSPPLNTHAIGNIYMK